jgi:hypothetical protein
MTFTQFSAAVRRAAFPEGSARNLVSRHENWLVDGLIDLQRYVRCMTYAHTSVYNDGLLRFSCGATVVSAPPGTIVAVDVINTQSKCDVVRCRPVPETHMRSLMDDWVFGCSNPSQGEPWEPYYGNLDQSGDPGRKLRKGDRRNYTRMDGSVVVFPALSEDEALVVLWNGKKTNWNSGDMIPWLDESGNASRVVLSAMEHYLLYNSYLYDDCDQQKAAGAFARYVEARRNMIIDCHELLSVPGRLETSVGHVGYNQNGFYGPASGVAAPIALAGYQALRAVTNPQDGQVFFILYGDTPGDNWGGYFIFDASSTDPESLPNIVKPDSISSGNPGRFLRQL